MIECLLITLVVMHWQRSTGDEIYELSHLPQCVLKCKDEHMQQMENEWSADFAFPLLSLLKATGNETAANHRAQMICRSNNLLIQCLKDCKESDEREILQLGLLPWKDVCANLDELRQQFPCWRLNIQNLTMNCRKPGVALHQSIILLAENHSASALHRICSAMDLYATCSVREFRRFCGIKSERLVDRQFWLSREAIYEMLKIKWPTVPESCFANYSEKELKQINQLKLSENRQTISDLSSAVIIFAILLHSKLQQGPLFLSIN